MTVATEKKTMHRASSMITQQHLDAGVMLGVEHVVGRVLPPCVAGLKVDTLDLLNAVR